jgi:hypothetical protein
MTATATATGRDKRCAALKVPEHPLSTREKRTAVNYALRARGVPAKACSLCLTIKSTAAFNKKGSASDGLEPNCRDCKAARHARRMVDDPAYREIMRASAQASYHRNYYPRWRGVIRERVREKRAVYVAANANRVRDPKVLKRCAGQCGQLLPETEFRLNRGVKDGLRDRCGRCSDACRRARRICLETYGDPVGQVCYLCGSEITARSEAWVDHVIPQSQGGPDTAENVRWTHDVCNTRRQADPLTPEQLERLDSTAPTRSGDDK